MNNSSVPNGFDPQRIYTPAFDLDYLEEIVYDIKPQISVEVGSWAGRTALVISKYSVATYCVDHWRGENVGLDWVMHDTVQPIFDVFCKNMGDRLNKSVFPKIGFSVEVARNWKIPIDFLFIDASHDYESVREDINSWYPHVKSSGTICGHDYTSHYVATGDHSFPGVSRAVDEKFPKRILRNKSTIWLSKK